MTLFFQHQHSTSLERFKQGEYRTVVKAHSLLSKKFFNSEQSALSTSFLLESKSQVTFLTNKTTVNTIVVAPKDSNSLSCFSNISEKDRRIFFNYKSFETRLIFENFPTETRSAFFISIFRRISKC